MLAADARRVGWPLSALRESGFGAAECKAARFPLDEMRTQFGPRELRAAGVSAVALAAAGSRVDELAEAGYTASELRAAGAGAGVMLVAFLSAERGVARADVAAVLASDEGGARAAGVRALREAGCSEAEAEAAVLSLVAAGARAADAWSSASHRKMLRAAEPATAWDDAPPSSPTKPPPRLARPHFADEHTTKAGRLNVQLLAKLHIRAAALKKKPRQEHRAEENQALVREKICEEQYEYWRGCAAWRAAAR